VFGEPGAWRPYDRVRHSELAQHRANRSKKAKVIFREMGSITGATRLRNFALRFGVELSIGFAQSEPTVLTMFSVDRTRSPPKEYVQRYVRP
jgi:hypothetical protein